VTTAEPTDLQALDCYTERLWRAKVPTAASVDWTTLRLVWLTVGLSVPAGRAAVSDCVCGLQPLQIARLPHLSGTETRSALDALVDAGRLKPLQCPGEGYRPRRHGAAARSNRGSFDERTVIDGVDQSP
jgi:hypothetical protein